MITDGEIVYNVAGTMFAFLLIHEHMHTNESCMIGSTFFHMFFFSFQNNSSNQQACVWEDMDAHSIAARLTLVTSDNVCIRHTVVHTILVGIYNLQL